MTLTTEQHDELLRLTEEMLEYASAGYAAPAGIFEERLVRAREILFEIIL